MTKKLLKDVKLCTGERMINNGYVLISDFKITSVGDMDQFTPLKDVEQIDLPKNAVIVPGFIDIHIHGAGGADTMDATTTALETMVNVLPQEGTTSLLATTITQEAQQIERALKNVANFVKNNNAPGKAEILGIHLEGPFISEKRAGAQPKEYILPASIELFKRWQTIANHLIKLVTIAPEKPEALKLIRYLSETNVIASIGHSDAMYDEMVKAVNAGAKQVTHLFNGMRELHHREPGVAGSALLFHELMAEMIVDGIHIHPEMVKLAINAKGTKGTILITDSMRAKCLKNGCYDLGGQKVNVSDGKAVLADGTLAGSILKMKDAIRNIISFTGISLLDAVQLASVNPAKQLGVFHRKGTISTGKDADLVVLDQNLEVIMTICRGKISYKREE
ncbi:N-acetylglucosamine-6-phosphate deacetylase [Bacillus aquiflavi]|uniref:N-acetylglucosamine-6-phosphate deacetylase n=1 Tax=Bacillus aquiflavi TaxID=2672567 RepID=A0A6B3VXZ6_9BACI|nr:N-acetylglucosamine-6-phosphate deacetylase [Bacillus aquiflavi]MBA4537555.1 N-acetylglucosamine-6-phosphate deacetylase [Bacillus aquiflavi]NEY81812.1 N-acetylglucosamine-6-phosphate deacetylase [Bacillus aquiflavi]UAC47828.1 N-acetylglucosamine-6-phosphate deacetylase [Bacillus aquiflavi]